MLICFLLLNFIYISVMCIVFCENIPNFKTYLLNLKKKVSEKEDLAVFFFSWLQMLLQEYILDLIHFCMVSNKVEKTIGPQSSVLLS